MTSIKIVSAPWPDSKDEDLAWAAGIRNALTEQQRLDFDSGTFVACDVCAAKSGTQSLCASCLANHHIVGMLQQALSAARAEMLRLIVQLDGARDGAIVNSNCQTRAECNKMDDANARLVSALEQLKAEPMPGPGLAKLLQLIGRFGDAAETTGEIFGASSARHGRGPLVAFSQRPTTPRHG